MHSIFRLPHRPLSVVLFCFGTLALLGLAAPCSAAATYYVATTGSDSSAGTLAAPFLTIQQGINTAVSGDTVTVEDGTYTGPGNVDLDFGGRNITVTSQNGATKTIIDCQGSSSVYHRGFYLHSGETSAVISGLTIENGYESSGGGGGIYNASLGMTAQNCIFQNNTAGGYAGGGGIYNITSGNATLTVTNCLFIDNTAGFYGGGIGISNQSSGTVLVTNCTLTGNTGYGSGAAIGNNTSANSSMIVLTNDILYGDSNGELLGAGITATHCDIQSGYVGTSNISSDPLFYNSPTDLHLQGNSPCLSAGTATGAPAVTIDGKTRPNPPSIGAYEAELTGTTVTTTTLTSNLNPSIAGQNVTLTAMVAGLPGTPTGSVTFFIDGAALSHIRLDSSGKAAYTSPIGVGTNTIIAVYSGDAVFAPSTSPVLTQTVTPAPTTVALTSSLNPAAFGQQVIFTASLTGIQPTGYLVFTDTTSSQFLGYGTLYGTTAVFATSSLSAGSHQIVASYQGDSSNSASESTALTQIVTPHTNPLYVSPSGNDSNIGTLAAPKQTFQAAMTVALGGDTVIAEDGTYTGLGNVDLDFRGKNITVTSQHGAATTIVDCAGFASADGSGNHRGFYLHSGETSAVISGLTIENGYESSGGGGGIYNASLGMTAQNCIFQNNTAGGYAGGGGIYSIPANYGISMFLNCVMIGNSAAEGGAIFSDTSNDSNLVVTNCTLTGNQGSSGSGGIYGASTPFGIGTIILTNDILYNNTGGEIETFNTVTYSSCDINADPLFVSGIPPYDLHLQPGSPCLGAGTVSGAPTTTIDGKTRPNPPSIGAYELTQIASPVMTTTTLTSSLNPSPFGQAIIFAAHVTATGAGGIPTGSITFAIDGTAQTPVTLDGNGNATLTTSALSVGSHSILASYSGDSSFAASTSPTLAQSVNASVPSPTNLMATAGPGKVTLTWTAPAGVSGATYSVFRGTASGAETFYKTANTATNFVNTYVTAGTTYYYTVQTVVNGRASSPSNEASATPTGAASVPAAPTNVNAVAGIGKVTLTWTASPGTVTSYSVYRGTSASSLTFYKTAGTATSFVNASVVNGTTYYYAIVAINSAGSSPLSLVVSATPQGVAVPGAPQNLTAVASGGKIALTWTASTGTVTSYSVYRGTASGAETFYKTANTSTMFVNTYVTAGTKYYYYVIALNSSGSSLASNEASATP